MARGSGRPIDLRPTDIIRALLPINSRDLRDGMRVGDAPRNRVLSYVRLKRIAIERDGELIELQRKQTEDDEEPLTRPRPKRRDCLCCGEGLMSTGPHHRLCDRCRRENNEW